jgi:hypothetical protein
LEDYLPGKGLKSALEGRYLDFFGSGGFSVSNNSNISETSCIKKKTIKKRGGKQKETGEMYLPAFPDLSG